MTINEPKQPEIELLKNVNALNKKFPSLTTPPLLTYLPYSSPITSGIPFMGKTMNQCKFKTYRLNAKKRCDKGNVIFLFVEK